MTKWLAVALGALVVGVLPAESSPRSVVFGVQWDGAKAVALVPYDASTLHRVGTALPLAGHGRAWSYSPGGAQLVLARSGAPAQATGSLRFVDLRGLRVLGSMPLNVGSIVGTAWLRSDRVVVTITLGDGSATLVLVDPVARRVLGQKALRGRLMRGLRAGSVDVLLLGPPTGIGASRVAIVDAELGVRFVTVGRIRAGWSSPPGVVKEPLTIAHRSPALAVDAAGSRAFVVGADEPLAEIDLRRATVSYRPLVERSQSRAAKSIEGPTRYAVWLGGGKLAVTGRTHDGIDPQTRMLRETPAGLWLVDVATGVSRLVDPETRWIVPAGRWLVSPDHGLTWYDHGGRRHGPLLGTQVLGRLALAGDRLLVQPAGAVPRTTVVDLRTGTIVGTRAGAPPYLLRGDAPVFQS